MSRIIQVLTTALILNADLFSKKKEIVSQTCGKITNGRPFFPTRVEDGELVSCES